MSSFPWCCPYCNHNATITGLQHSVSNHYFNCNNALETDLLLKTMVTVCPNLDCREFEISAILGTKTPRGSIGNQLMSWRLKPDSNAKPLPSYIPKAIVEDYREACLIRELSPKSSATLARRCLQGIIRDFWKDDVKPGRLVDEIRAISSKVDPITWQAIDGVRNVGNIGAHMEKDIDHIVEVEPEEAQLLIGLLEHLMKEWYINRHERLQQMQALIGLADKKKEQRKVTSND